MAASEYHFGGLHHTQLAMPAGEEPTVRSFYRDVLGMTELDKPPALAARGGCWFRSGDLELHLGVERDFRPARKAHPGMLVSDIDALADRLAASGVEVDWDDGFPAHRRFYCHDPLGNRLEFLQPAERASAPLS
jgi:catechol 2,3-dioxygenase-like lactoylglutathione lyase family enzyme